MTGVEVSKEVECESTLKFYFAFSVAVYQSFSNPIKLETVQKCQAALLFQLHPFQISTSAMHRGFITIWLQFSLLVFIIYCRMNRMLKLRRLEFSFIDLNQTLKWFFCVTYPTYYVLSVEPHITICGTMLSIDYFKTITLLSWGSLI